MTYCVSSVAVKQVIALSSKWLELTKSLHGLLLCFHCRHVVVQHLGHRPARYRLYVWPRNALLYGIGGKSSPEYMAGVLQFDFRPFCQALQILPDSIVSLPDSLLSNPYPIKRIATLLHIAEHRSLAVPFKRNLPLPLVFAIDHSNHRMVSVQVLLFQHPHLVSSDPGCGHHPHHRLPAGAGEGAQRTKFE